jgi:undecaprenyl diphosphate synthase
VANDSLYFAENLKMTNSFFLDTDSEEGYFAKEALASLQGRPIPHHVAIIMDGNRRWARNQTLSRTIDAVEGHWEGARCIYSVTEAAKEIGIKVLTLFGLSTENIKRSPLEVKVLMHILEQYLKEMRPKMIEKDVKFSTIGDIELLPEGVQYEIARTKEATKKGTAIELVIAVNYGGKDDIKRAFVKIAEKLQKGEISKEAIDENLIARYLDTAKWPDPDLLIRTSAESRVSNFMLWQLAYSEIHVTDVLWPDFRPAHLLEAVMSYQGRQRRIGQ